MSDSSSEDEYLEKLQQSVDNQFINDDLFKSSGKIKDEKVSVSLPPSLRSIETDEWQSCNGLHVTPEFQKHVAKHLSALLDNQLKEVELAKPKRKKKKSRGVRLLSSCDNYVDCKDEQDISASHNAKRKARELENNVDSEEEGRKVGEAAVDAEWLLKGEAIKGWVKSTKGEVITGVHHKQKKKKKKKVKSEDDLCSKIK